MQVWRALINLSHSTIVLLAKNLSQRAWFVTTVMTWHYLSFWVNIFEGSDLACTSLSCCDRASWRWSWWIGSGRSRYYIIKADHVSSYLEEVRGWDLEVEEQVLGSQRTPFLFPLLSWSSWRHISWNKRRLHFHLLLLREQKVPHLTPEFVPHLKGVS